MRREYLHLTKVLHEPLAPYLANVYNNLTHLIQGLVLAAIFYVISIQESITFPVALNIIISFGFVIVIWHSFIMHNQYIAIRASIFDTLLPIVLAVFQCILALAVTQPIYIHTFLIFPIMIMLEFIMLNAYIKNKNQLALKVFEEHFKELGSAFAKEFYIEFRNFEKLTIKNRMRLVFIILIFLNIFNFYFPFTLDLKTYFNFIVVGIIIILMGYFDVNRFFNKSKKLGKYGYKW